MELLKENLTLLDSSCHSDNSDFVKFSNNYSTNIIQLKLAVPESL